MALTINHNTLATTVADNLESSYSSLSTSTERLSSGLRINSASDDAAGLAVREIMRTEISSLDQGERNANDAISMIDTADGALGVIDEKLIRMKELAMQASTGTYSSDQRVIIDSEYQAMASEITRIAASTDFNGIHLLNGYLSGDGTISSGMRIHFGTGNDCSEDYYYVQIDNCSASALGLGSGTGGAGATISTQAAAEAALTALDAAVVSKDKIRAHLGALENRLDATITNLTVQNENISSAESQISDVDVSTEMTNYTEQDIKVQSAVAMLSQANSLSKLALQLIQS